MPNICNVEGVVTGKRENVRKFLNLFLTPDSEENKKKERYFARTTLINYEKEELDNLILPYKDGLREAKEDDIITINIDFICAWSVSVCMFEDDNFFTFNSSKVVILGDILRELDIGIQWESEELGIGFREYIFGDSEGINYNCVPIKVYECHNCEHEEVVEDGDTEPSKCPQCQTKF